MAPRRPLVLSSPNIWASLPIWETALSPRSSPRATLILSAPSTNSSTAAVDVMPSLPASSASWLSFWRGVRVSIFLKSSFIRSTSSAACPVYLRTLVISSSILAYSSTHFLTVKVIPEMAATAPRARPCMRLNQSAERLIQDSCATPSALTACSSAFSCLACLSICLNCSVPRCMPCICWLRALMEYSRSRMEEVLRFDMVLLTSCI